MQGCGNGSKIITAAKGINAAVGLNRNVSKAEWIMTKAEIIEKVKEVIAAPSCCPEAKAACQAYLDAVGTEGEKTAEKAMIAELKEDVTELVNLMKQSNVQFEYLEVSPHDHKMKLKHD